MSLPITIAEVQVVREIADFLKDGPKTKSEIVDRLGVVREDAIGNLLEQYQGIFFFSSNDSCWEYRHCPFNAVQNKSCLKDVVLDCFLEIESSPRGLTYSDLVELLTEKHPQLRYRQVSGIIWRLFNFKGLIYSMSGEKKKCKRYGAVLFPPVSSDAPPQETSKKPAPVQLELETDSFLGCDEKYRQAVEYAKTYEAFLSVREKYLSLCRTLNIEPVVALSSPKK